MASLDQNSEIGIACLIAQRRLYSIAKGIRSIRAGIAGPLAVTIGLAFTIFIEEISTFLSQPEANVRTALALFSSVLLIVNEFFLMTAASKRITKAAQIQETFDCGVLDIPPNTTLCKLANLEEISRISEEAKFTKPQMEKLKNWYSPLPDDIPATIATTIRQRANLYWDSELRSQLIKFVAWAVPSILIMIAVYAAIIDMRVRELTLFLPLVPLLVYLQRTAMEHKTAQTRSKELFSSAERLWNDALNGRWKEPDFLTSQRQLQDQIYQSRRDGTPVPDWLYWLRRNRQEKAMYFSTEQMIRDWNHSQQNS